jgi:hypothetical protein
MKKIAFALIVFYFGSGCGGKAVKIECVNDNTDSLIEQSKIHTEKFDSLSVNFDESIEKIKEKLEK